MELLSLEIESFGCIGRTRVAFKPELNVLHGANEVGKSTIARAIRFALLLQSYSSAADPWIPWSGGGDPTVTLAFRKGDECHRVKKVFGTSNAVLERSLDGAAWASVARGREVDARLRASLQWGIAEPGGGKGGIRGIPESFLATALLADQDDVDRIFERDLQDDGADSGRMRVRAALQALAQDPLFKSVLDEAQARVAEAFMSDGKPRRAANSPYKKMADEINEVQSERDDAEQNATRGAVLAERVGKLRHEVARAEAEYQENAATRSALEQTCARQMALAMAAEQRGKAQRLADAVTEARGRIKEADDVLRELEPRLPELREAADVTRKAFEAATSEASVARERRRTELLQEQTAIMSGRETLRTRQVSLNLALDVRKADGLHREGGRLRETLRALEQEVVILRLVEPWTNLQSTTAHLEATTQRERKASELSANATDLRSRAAAQWPTAASDFLPDAQRLAKLRKLWHELNLAEVKLDVGLSVEVRGVRSAFVSVDGAAKSTKESPFEIEAKRFAAMELGGGIKVSVRGGRAEHREEAERLRGEWHDETASLFASVGITDFPALDEACRLEAEGRAAANVYLRDASALELEVAKLGDAAADKQRLSAQVAELEEHLRGTDLTAIEAAAKFHGSGSRAILASRVAECETRRLALAKVEAQEAALRERVAIHCGGASPAMADLDAELAALAEAKESLDQREALLAEARDRLDTPATQHDVIEGAATKAKWELADALAKVGSAKGERDTWSARLEERIGAANGMDLRALVQVEDAARAATSQDGPLVHELAVTDARKAEEAAKGLHEKLLGELRLAEGSLQASGGAAAEERLRDLDAALQRAHEKRAMLEDDYEAWKLLTEALKEAERNQATHLGNVLAPDLTARFLALAGGRYAGIALSPHLRLESVFAAGAPREKEQLSIGTREQLSTLFRLSLAERLKTALLLDDQLVQSDPDRLRWFRQALRQTVATGVQVIVLTCRPDDYLEPAESPPPHVIDLRTVVVG
jgi:AAA domain-containing protein